MMPPAGALIPIYLIFNRNGLIFKDWGPIDLRDWNLIDTFTGMIPLMMLLNLPIIIWMLYTYFKEIPVDILEAARMDGAGLRQRARPTCWRRWRCRASPRRCCST